MSLSIPKTLAKTQLVEEAAIAVTLNGVSYVVMLASPYDLEDFAVGLLFSENIIASNIEIHDIQQQVQQKGIQLEVTLANRCYDKFKAKQRNIKGSSGCGLCGKTALEDAFPKLTVLNWQQPPPLKQINLLKSQLSKWQKMAQHSGALHAAFWIDKSTQIIACREDIGRHNAVDKLIGYSKRNHIDPVGCSLLVTSRCSVEIVQKAVACGVNSLISLASPSQLALDFALNHKLNLIHIPRKDKPHNLTEGLFDD